MTSFTIQVAGGALPVKVSGAGPVTIICVHGWTLDHTVWAPQHDGLKEAARVVSFDRRGFGEATAPAALSAEPDDLRAIVEYLGGSRVWLIGQSQGARVATAFALAHPSMVAGLILQGAPAMNGDLVQGEVPYGHFRDLMAAGNLAQVRREWLAHPLMGFHDRRAARAVRDIVARYDGRDLLSTDGGLKFDDAQLASLECPTLIVVGECEAAGRKQAADALATTLPNACKVEVPEAGHLCNLENPAAFNAHVRRLVGT